ncbi:MAG: efflux RND transporter periplasmic adaptor subunit [Gemmatimonas sp.]|nr:efflux RND transporter periplasmic adaptor subunit [Gemmatimonas sp.]
MTKSKKLLVGGSALVVLFSLAGIAVANQRDRGVEIRTEVAARRDVVSQVTASGYVQPMRKVDISADISGRVTDLLVEEGQWVEQGDLLLRIDPTSYEANVRRAAATVAQARADAAQARANKLRAQGEYDRAERMSRAENLISAAELELAQTELLVAEAQLESVEYGVAQAEAGLSEAQEQLRKTTISAPMSGHVTRLNIEVGETAIVGTMNNPGSLLLTIADLSTMETRVRVGETDIPDISLGDRAEVRIDAYPNKIFTGEVTQIANSAVTAPTSESGAPGQQAQAIDFEVIVTLSTPPSDLRPDLTATAEIVTDTRVHALTVPIIAVTVRDERGRRFDGDSQSSASGPQDETDEVEGVFLLRNGEPVWAPVQVGIVGDWYFELVAGVEEGDTVISGPYAAVRDLEPDATIRVTGSSEGTEAPGR